MNMLEDSDLGPFHLQSIACSSFPKYRELVI